jgi:hypothetical protein
LSDDKFSAAVTKSYANKMFPTLGVVFPRGQSKPYDDSLILYDVDNIFVFDKSALTEKADGDASKSKSVKLSNHASAPKSRYRFYKTPISDEKLFGQSFILNFLYKVSF